MDALLGADLSRTDALLERQAESTVLFDFSRIYALLLDLQVERQAESTVLVPRR